MAEAATVQAEPVVPVTDGEEVQGKVIHFPGPDPIPNAEARDAGARARIAATLRDSKILAGVGATCRQWASGVVEEARSEARRSVWSDPPEALGEHAAYLRSGAWSDVPLLILLGHLYGWPAFALRAALLVPAWLVARPSRLFVAMVVAMVVKFTV
jgi:hypothetical protein